jgi:glycosyltransferase involved in cell wall biosynthesis
MNLLTVTGSVRMDIVSYQALHMAAQFQKWGHNVSLMCPAESRLCVEAPKLDLAAKAFNFRRRLGFLDGPRFDIVHLYEPGPTSTRFLEKISASSRVFVSQITLGGSVEMARLKKLEPYVDRFIASCPSVREDLSGAGIDPDKTFIIPPGISPGRWESAMLIKPVLGLKGPFKVGMISMDRTLGEQKFFLEVAKEVLTILPETNFMVVGFRDERIRDMARELGISHKVDVLWEREDVPEIMAMLNIFVKAASRPGLSMSLMEAQASGVACVIPRVRGFSDFIVHKENGILAEPGDISSFTWAIISLIENPAFCRSIAKTAYDRLNFNMSMPVVANLMRCYYEDALASS